LSDLASSLIFTLSLHDALPILEDYHICIDHERYRHASFSFRTLFWGYMAGCGKAFFYIFLPITAIVFFLDQSYLKPGESKWELRSEEHTSELQSRENLVCRLLL